MQLIWMGTLMPFDYDNKDPFRLISVASHSGFPPLASSLGRGWKELYGTLRILSLFEMLYMSEVKRTLSASGPNMHEPPTFSNGWCFDFCEGVYPQCEQSLR